MDGNRAVPMARAFHPVTGKKTPFFLPKDNSSASRDIKTNIPAFDTIAIETYYHL
jgi:hypothetical protein